MNAVSVDIDFLASLPARALLKLADAAGTSKRSLDRLHRTIMDHEETRMFHSASELRSAAK